MNSRNAGRPAACVPELGFRRGGGQDECIEYEETMDYFGICLAKLLRPKTTVL
jgi:hypothetical protein